MADPAELARRLDQGHTIPVTRRPIMPGGGGHFAQFEITAVVLAADVSTGLPAGFDGFIVGTDSGGNTVSAGFGAGFEPSSGDTALVQFNPAGDGYLYDLVRAFTT